MDEYMVYHEILDRLPLSSLEYPLNREHNKYIKRKKWRLYRSLYNDMIEKNLIPQFSLQEDLVLMFPSMLILIIKSMMADIQQYFTMGHWSYKNNLMDVAETVGEDDEDTYISYSWFGYNPLTIELSNISETIYNKLMADSYTLREVHNNIW